VARNVDLGAIHADVAFALVFFDAEGFGFIS
jgi:hypothetical protein